MFLEDNAKKPLSFRCWGAFTCPTLPLSTLIIKIDARTPQEVASEILTWSEQQLEAARNLLKQKRSSDAVAGHPNQIEQGDYTISLVTALILKKEYEKAAEEARAYVEG